MDFHPFLCQSTHVPNVMAVTFVKLMEFDGLGLVGFLYELAPQGVEHHRERQRTCNKVAIIGHKNREPDITHATKGPIRRPNF